MQLDNESNKDVLQPPVNDDSKQDVFAAFTVEECGPDTDSYSDETEHSILKFQF